MYSMSKEEIYTLIKGLSFDELIEYANAIRGKFMANKAELCSIMNVKSGRCSENCKYCAQSVHYNTGAAEFSLLNKDQVLRQALENQKLGAKRFSLVTSGRGLDDIDFEQILLLYETLVKNTDLSICASNGILPYEKLKALKAVGVTRYHHNIETSREYYNSICTTHTFDDRINTINNAKRAGLDVCSGGIIGMGESMEDRIDMAFELCTLDIKSIPINILNPIPGTPLESIESITPMEVIASMAIFRIINPKAYIRFAGGRGLLGDMQSIGLRAGVNAALTGNFLTTTGSDVDSDIKMFTDAGFIL